MNMKVMLRGQIWLFNSDPTIGDEIGKTRPAIIVNNDEIGTLRLKVVVPITGWNDAFASTSQRKSANHFYSPLSSLSPCPPCLLVSLSSLSVAFRFHI
jgi:PemK-like, MazF-like toxin of type II toxin-antitoxin system